MSWFLFFMRGNRVCLSCQTLPHFNSSLPMGRILKEIAFRGKARLFCDQLPFLPDCGPGLALPGPAQKPQAAATCWPRHHQVPRPGVQSWTGLGKGQGAGVPPRAVTRGGSRGWGPRLGPGILSCPPTRGANCDRAESHSLPSALKQPGLAKPCF